jgi:diacylglycerol kinase family enzyme
VFKSKSLFLAAHHSLKIRKSKNREHEENKQVPKMQANKCKISCSPNIQVDSIKIVGEKLQKDPSN